MRKAMLVCALVVLVSSTLFAHAARVGIYGDPARIEIAGARSFPTNQLLKQLVSTPAFLLLSHPLADRVDYREGLAYLLKIGYQNSGFRDVEVASAINFDSEHVVLTIREGPRHFAGDVAITGLRSIPAETLRVNLTSDWQRVEAVDTAVDPALWKPGDPALWKPVDPALWKPGDPAPFGDYFRDSVRDRLKQLFLENGWFQPEFKIGVIPDPGTNTATLSIVIVDEGRKCRIKEIRVSGLERNSRGDILQLIGLKEGETLDRKKFELVTARLRNCGRFTQYSATQQVAGKEEGIILDISVKEHPLVSRLGESLPSEAEANMVFANWLSALSSTDNDIRVRLLSPDSGETLTALTLSNREGLIARLGAQNTTNAIFSALKATVLLTPDRIQAFFPKRKRTLTSEVHNTELSASFRLTVETNDVHASNLMAFFGFSTFRSGSRFKTSFDVDPCALVSRAYNTTTSVCTVKGDILTMAGTNDAWRLVFDWRNRQLKSFRVESDMGFNVSVEVAPGLFKEDVAALRNYGEGNTEVNLTGQPAPLVVSKTAVELLFLIEGLPDLPVPLTENCRLLRGLVEEIAGAGLSSTGVLSGVREEDFIIPFRNDLMPTNNPAVVFAAVVYTFAAGMFPYESWPVVLAREVAFQFAGKGSYTAESIQNLLKSRDMGPVGCRLAAELISRVNPPAGAAFAAKGLDVANEEGFGKDIELLFCAIGSVKELSKTQAFIERLNWNKVADIMVNASTNKSEQTIAQIRRLGSIPPGERIGEFASILWRQKSFARSVTASLRATMLRAGLQSLPPEKVQELLRKADKGDASAQVELALRHTAGAAVEQNFDAAAVLLERAALSGDKQAQYLMGVSAFEGWHADARRPVGYAWVKTAVASDPEGKRKLSEMAAKMAPGEMEAAEQEYEAIARRLKVKTADSPQKGVRKGE